MKYQNKIGDINIPGLDEFLKKRGFIHNEIITSLPVTPLFNLPVNLILEIGGICHQVYPVAHRAAASVLTTGVPKHPIPPYIFE